MGEAKRRKAALGDRYGTTGTSPTATDTSNWWKILGLWIVQGLLVGGLSFAIVWLAVKFVFPRFGIGFGMVPLG